MFGKEILHKILKENSLNISEFADIVGVTQPSISRILSGHTKKVSRALAVKIVENFPNYTMEYLMTGSEKYNYYKRFYLLRNYINFVHFIEKGQMPLILKKDSTAFLLLV